MTGQNKGICTVVDDPVKGSARGEESRHDTREGLCGAELLALEDVKRLYEFVSPRIL